jgi:AcrR family transcriptional regulator
MGTSAATDADAEAASASGIASDSASDSASDTVDRGPRTKRVRKRPEARRAELVTAARKIFAESGYAEVGMNDVAAAASVSKALVYHYFPEGRLELLACVVDDLLAEFRERLRHAANVPFSGPTRMEHLLGALFGFFDENPAAYRLLFRDSWLAQDNTADAPSVAVRVRLASEFAAVMGSSGRPADDMLAASVGILGFALANVELALAGEIDPEVAWRVTCEYASIHLRQ